METVLEVESGVAPEADLEAAAVLAVIDALGTDHEAELALEGVFLVAFEGALVVLEVELGALETAPETEPGFALGAELVALENADALEVELGAWETALVADLATEAELFAALDAVQEVGLEDAFGAADVSECTVLEDALYAELGPEAANTVAFDAAKVVPEVAVLG